MPVVTAESLMPSYRPVSTRTSSTSPAAKYLSMCRFNDAGDDTSPRTIRRFAIIQNEEGVIRGTLRSPINQTHSEPTAEDHEKFDLLIAKRVILDGNICKNVGISSRIGLARCGEYGMYGYLRHCKEFPNGVGTRDRAVARLIECENDHMYSEVEFIWDKQSITSDPWVKGPPIFTRHLTDNFAEGREVKASTRWAGDKKALMSQFEAAHRIIQRNKEKLQAKTRAEFEKVQEYRGEGRLPDRHYYPADCQSVNIELLDSETAQKEQLVKNRLNGLIDTEGDGFSEALDQNIDWNQLSEAQKEVYRAAQMAQGRGEFLDRVENGDHLKLLHEARSAGIQREMTFALRKVKHKEVSGELTRRAPYREDTGEYRIPSRSDDTKQDRISRAFGIYDHRRMDYQAFMPKPDRT